MASGKTIAIIPARGGSKGIPRKNLLDLCGKPLIAWTILSALGTKEIDEVYVSSDSTQILEAASKFGAKTIKRPEEISGDTATSESAIVHAISQIKDVKTVLMLQPTSPLRRPDDLSRALKQFVNDGDDSLFSGGLLEDFLIWEEDGKNGLKSMNYDFKSRGRRQDRKSQYVENGSFYIFTPQVLAAGNRLGGKIGIYLMEFWQSFEIDNLEDAELVKMLFEKKLMSNRT